MILEDLEKSGIKVELTQEGIKLFPKDKVTKDIVELVKRHKKELRQLLTKQGHTQLLPQPKEPCYVCGDYNWWLSIYGNWVCGTCHPPASKKLVKQTIGPIKIDNKVFH